MAHADTLQGELARYDGRDPEILREIAARRVGQAQFLSELTGLASNEVQVVSEGATWIIKSLLEQGQALDPRDVERLIAGLEDVTAWQAQLHICQSVGMISVTGGAARPLAQWLRARLGSPRPLLRAWALDGLCRLLGPSAQTTALLDQFEADAAASVRARVRNLRRVFAKA